MCGGTVLLKDEATWKQFVTVCHKTWKQTLYVVCGVQFRFFVDEVQSPLAAVTHTGRNHDVRRKLCPLDQQAAFADVHLSSMRPYTIVLIVDWWIYIEIFFVSEKYPLCASDLQTTKKLLFLTA